LIILIIAYAPSAEMTCQYTTLAFDNYQKALHDKNSDLRICGNLIDVCYKNQDMRNVLAMVKLCLDIGVFAQDNPPPAPYQQKESFKTPFFYL
jgi:hypothetical protein